MTIFETGYVSYCHQTKGKENVPTAAVNSLQPTHNHLNKSCIDIRSSVVLSSVRCHVIGLLLFVSDMSNILAKVDCRKLK